MLSDALSPQILRTLATQWLQEDAPSLDYAGAVVGERVCSAEIHGNSDSVLAGVPFVDEIFSQLGCRINWLLQEGTAYRANLESRVVLARIEGPANRVLLGERLALNLLARAGGIAFRACQLVALKKEHGFKGDIAGTRKTTPGFRIVEKYAMNVGGVMSMDLSSMVMLKDNHLAVHTSLASAVASARQLAGFSTKIEVECSEISQVADAIKTSTDVIMLDNFTPSQLEEPAMQTVLASRRPGQLVEVSGGITIENISSFFVPGVDIVSSSWVATGSGGVADVSLSVVFGK